MIETLYFDILDSTNTEAKRILNGESKNMAKVPFVLLANAQTAGRGRQGRSFYSPADTGIYMSVVIDADEMAGEIALVTVKAAVVVSDVIKEITGVDTRIKWVNDLYYNDLKVCGILAESIFVADKGCMKKCVIVGIGINVSTCDFPNEIKNIAGSLGKDSSESVKKRICNMIAERMIVRDEDKVSLIRKYREKSIVLGKEVSFYKNSVLHTGTAVDINDNGELIVRESDGNEHVLQSGEISLKSW